MKNKDNKSRIKPKSDSSNLDVLLISPPLFRLYGMRQPSPPLGLLYLSRYLNVNGINARVYNADYEGGVTRRYAEIVSLHEGYSKNLSDMDFEAWKSVRQMVRKTKPKIVGISTVTSTFQSSLNCVKIIREELPNAKIFLGGAHVTALPEEAAVVPGVSAVIMGEGERTLLDLSQGKPYNAIPGLCYAKDGKTVRTGERELIQDLDSLPFPILEDLIVEKIKPTSFGEIMSSRGCPYNCLFCASVVIWGRKLRLRSPENIYEEIVFRKTKYKTKFFQFWDDTLTISGERILRICLLLKKLRITWSCQTKANHVSKDILRKMKDAGCVEIALGIESGNQRVLDIAKKNQKIEDIIRASKLIKEAGIFLNTFFMLGLPGETNESIEDTFKLIDTIKPDGILANIAVPLPGTEFFQMAKDCGWITDYNWSNYYWLGRKDSIVKMPSVDKKSVIDAYWRLQKIADDINTRKRRKYFLNPLYLMKHVSLEDFWHPTLFLRKARTLFYFIFRK